MLIFAVGQRLRWGHRNRVAGVDTHGVYVFDGANDDKVVGLIAHHLQLILLPPHQRPFNQNFTHRALAQPVRHDLGKVVWPLRHAAARAAHRKGCPHQRGIANLGHCFPRFFQRVNKMADGNGNTGFNHGLLKTGTVFGQPYGA